MEPRVLALAASLVLLPAAGVEREEMTVLARKNNADIMSQHAYEKDPQEMILA